MWNFKRIPPVQDKVYENQTLLTSLNILLHLRLKANFEIDSTNKITSSTRAAYGSLPDIGTKLVGW
jgi:hypothetical protein